VRCEFCRKKEPHFSSVRSVIDGGRARGPCSFGGYENCLRSTAANYERAEKFNSRSQVQNLKSQKELISEN
jgi:hypothetical protein